MGGGLRLRPLKALPAMAAMRTAPPSSVQRPAVSPSANHTQNGPSTTSLMASSANSAAGTALEP